jgi:uncharacterized NAD(P)/FAD-binding protein YdhS
LKTHLLEQERIRYLYGRRLKEKLKPITQDVEDDWQNIKEAVLTAAKESLGYKSIKKNWIRTWIEDLKVIIDGKKHAYKKYLQSRSRGDYVSCKKL